MFRREGIALLVAEVIGTFALTFVVLSVSKSPIGIPYFVAIAAGLTLAIVVLTLGRAPGVHINPAVTFSMWAVRKIGTLQGLLFIAAQFMGAAFAWRLYTYFVNTTVPSIASKEFDWRIFVAEMVGTAVFVLGVTAAVYKNYEGGKFAATLGGSLVLGIVIASSISNGVINPAVALGVQSWSKEYVLAPLAGGLIGANLYTLLFVGEQFAVRTSGLRLPGRNIIASKVGFATKSKTVTSKVKPSAKTKKTKVAKKRSR